MTVRRTNTNPSGLPMERVNISIPLEAVFKMKRIADDQHKQYAVCYREAILEYIDKYYVEEQRKIIKGEEFNKFVREYFDS